MNKKFISKSNRVLRKILNSKENLYILQDFIETFLDIKVKEIRLNPYLKSKSNYLPSEENYGIADVRVKLENQEELNIGIQFIDGYYAENKMLLYYAQIHTNQLEYGDNRRFAKTITINLLDFNYLKSDNYFTKVTIPSKIEEEIELYILELSKFKLDTYENLTKKEIWMLYLCGVKEEILPNIINRYHIIKQLDNLLEEYWRSEVME